MKKLNSSLITVILTIFLCLPISSMASEVIQLAAAIGSGAPEASTTGNASGGAIGSGTATTTTGATVATGAALSTATIVTLGVVTAGVVIAANKTSSTSNH